LTPEHALKRSLADRASLVAITSKVGGSEPDFLKNIMGACSGSADVGVAAIGAGAPDRMKLGTLCD
jgi:hypothetical protein